MENKKTVFVTGGRGMLGSYLIPMLEADGMNVVAPTKRSFNSTNVDHWRIQMVQYRPDVIINLSAMTNVDECESNVEDAIRNNALVCELMAQYAPNNTAIIHMSAANVFGSTGKEYPTEDNTDFRPLSVYSMTKLMGEIILKQAAEAGLISNVAVIRSGWIFGGGQHDKKFIGKIIKKLIRKEPVQIAEGTAGQPVYAKDLAEFISLLAMRPQYVRNSDYRNYHFGNESGATRMLMAEMIKRVIGSTSVVTPVENSTFKLAAERPVRELLDYTATEKLVGGEFPAWESSLLDYLNTEFAIDKKGHTC